MSKRFNLRYKIELKLFICQVTIYISIQLKILVANNKSGKNIQTLLHLEA